MGQVFANVIGFDDGPFLRNHRGDVPLIGTVCARTRLDGVLSGKVRRDGRNATDRMIELITTSQFDRHIQAVLLQGVAVAGFNVVDAHRLHATLARPVLIVARRKPRMDKIKNALLGKVPGGKEKWRLIEQLGDMEALRGLYVQRIGLTQAQASHLLAATTLHGHLPEALRLAHIIAGGITTGQSRGRA